MPGGLRPDGTSDRTPAWPVHDDFGGLHRDLPRLLGRRRALQILGGVSLAGLVAACSSDSPGSTGGDTTSSSSGASSPSTTAASTAAASAGEEIPDETQGPFPADGSNGPNALTEDGIVRSDLTTSFGDAGGTAEVYEGLDRATAGSEAVKTSQIALPESDCDAAYTDSRYGQSAGNLAQLSLTSDMVFSDGWSDQLATVVGSIREGYTASLLVRV